MNNPIFITGTPRSGKTLIAGILDICGVKAGITNPMFENLEIQEKVIGPYLTFHGNDSNGLGPLLHTRELVLPPDWNVLVERYIQKQGVFPGEKWMLKSHSIIPTWPVWYHHFRDSKYVIVRRRSGDIINSCLKTGYMVTYQDREGWKSMVNEYEKRIVEMLMKGVNCKVIWPERMVCGDYGQIYELLDWLGLPWKTEILPYIDPKFWKIRKKK